MTAREISVQGIAEILKMEPVEDQRVYSRLSGFEDASPDAIVFAQDEASLERALATKAGLILAPASLGTHHDARVFGVKNPKYAFAQCGKHFDSLDRDGFIHPSAVIAEDVHIGEGTSVGAGTVVKAGAYIGEGCAIGSNVTIYGNVRIGDEVVVQAGAVLGAMGFGYVRGENGEYVRFPQQGSLIIEDDVEIGANTTIDRGALGETRIGRGTKIDNQVHIGHNCVIGKNVVIAAQVGISGSCVIEDGVVLAGQVGLGDHVTIGKGVIMGGASGVFPHKRVDGPGQMFMGVPAEPLKDYLKTLARVRRLK